VFAIQRRLFSRSNFGILLVNREGGSKYDRNLGLEYNLASKNNLWTGKVLYLRSFQSGQRPGGSVYAGHLQYFSRRWLLLGQAENVDTNYTADAGYVPRRGYHRGSGTIGYTFLPKGGHIMSHGPSLITSNFFDWGGRLSDYETTLGYTVTLRNQDVLTTSAGADYVRLLQPFDPTNSGRAKLAADTEHRWKFWNTSYATGPQRVFSYGYSSSYGGYYAGGTKVTLTGNVGYRFLPYVSLAGAVTYNDIRLRAPWGDTKFWLVGPKFDVTLTNTLYFTTYIQYNEQQRNMNVNARVQWRYKPASDMFLVWTDNYLPENLQPGQNVPGMFTVKNRAVVLKWTYWWNL
jgi:hypothetical protein